MIQLLSRMLMGILCIACTSVQANTIRDTTVMLCRYGSDITLSDLVPQDADTGIWHPNVSSVSPADGDQVFLYTVDKNGVPDTLRVSINVVGSIEKRTIDTTFCKGDSIFIGNVWFKTNTNATAVTYDLENCIRYENRYKIRVSTPLPIELTYDTTAQCLTAKELQIDLTENTGYVYTWSDGYMGSDRVINTSGRYIVTGMINNGCTVSDTIDILFHAPPKLWIKPDTFRLKLGDAVQLNPMTDNGKRIVWSPSDDLSCSNCWQPILTAKENRQYLATTYDAYGCIDTAYVMVQIKPLLALPTVFSPSASTPQNRYFGVVSRLVKEYTIYVYDRWGNTVYTAHQLSPSPMTGWNGTVADQAANSGVYVYHIEYIDEDEQSNVITGTVTLLR